MSKVSLRTEWAEGTEADFAELHRAKLEGKTQRLDSNNDESSSDSEEFDDSEPDEIGPKFLWNAQHGKLDEIRKMLDSDAKLISFRDSDGYTALHRASYSNHAEVVKYLLEFDPKCVEVRTEDGWTALHSACRWNARDAVEVMLQRGRVEVNAVTNGGQTVLHLAAFCGGKETLQLLFMRHDLMKETLKAKNCQGDTALDIALRNGKCVQLLEHLCDIATLNCE